MAEFNPTDRLDRHALVMAIWTPSAFVAAVLLHKGLAVGGGWWIFAGFAAILTAFCGHIVVNAVLGTGFSAGERALGMVAFATAVVGLILTWLFGSADIDSGVFLPVAVGLASIVIAVIAYMVIAFGPRAAFEKFDVIRDNNLRQASRLPHRGGRR